MYLFTAKPKTLEEYTKTAVAEAKEIFKVNTVQVTKCTLGGIEATQLEYPQNNNLQQDIDHVKIFSSVPPS